MKILTSVCAIIAFVATYFVVESVQKFYAIDKKITQIRDEEWRQAKEMELMRILQREIRDDVRQEMQRRGLSPKVLCDSIIPQDCFEALWHRLHDTAR